MHESDLTFSRLFLPVIILSIIITSVLFITVKTNTATKIVFCDVGQGDAAYLRIKNKIDVLIDAGPNNKILDCLGKYMPFFDRKIEIALLTHPQRDHFFGYLTILDRYKIDRFITTRGKSSSQSYIKLKNKIEAKKIKLLFAESGQKLKIFDDILYVLWPQNNFTEEKINKLDVNYFSLIALFEESGLKILFTADAPPLVLDQISMLYNNLIQDTSILKIPHHGSKNGLTRNFLLLADPDIAVISVGKNNPYGHPANQIIDMLKASNTKIIRTDEEGHIAFWLDKKGQVRSNKQINK